ncbi:MAG: hypothetical protein R3348_07845 [Xanthomonadales bacterium]|nr:hypothetical protein [Xanthomonadales bacterium]
MFAGRFEFPGGKDVSRRVVCLLTVSCFLLACAVSHARTAHIQNISAGESSAATGLNQVIYLKANYPNISEFYGNAMDLDGDTLVVGVVHDSSASAGINGNEDDNSIPQAGAVYVYVRKDGQWVQQAYIKASNPDGGDVFGSPGDKFGQSVALDGDTLVVGAPEERSGAQGVNGNQADNSIPNAGAAYVFVRNGETWSQQAYLKASNTPNQFPNLNTFYFGTAVAISGDYIAVGAPAEDSLSSGINGSQSYTRYERIQDNEDTGAVFVFARNGSSWSQQTYIKASNPSPAGTVGNGGTSQVAFPGDQFGSVLDMHGNTLVVGVPNESSNARGVNGNQNDENGGFSGAAYVFVRNGSSWSQQAYIKSSNSDPADSFGAAVAIHEDRLVVGAPQEKASATGVNGDQENNSMANAGAAYVFERIGSDWTQTAYIKSSNTFFGNRFGTAVAQYRDTLAIGATGEGSATTGIDGDQSSNTAPEAGAVYLFRKSGETWSQIHYIKASNTDGGDAFGSAVAINERYLAVSAPGEDSGDGGIDAEQSDNSILSTGAAYIFEGLDSTGVAINQGMNDAWVSDDAPFQGLFITVFEQAGIVFLSWFTFDSEPDASAPAAVFGANDTRWVTAAGGFSGNTATLTAELTSGGIFNAADPVAMQVSPYGTMTLVFNSCNEAVLTYDFPGPGLSGQMTLKRVLPSNVPLCESLSAP